MATAPPVAVNRLAKQLRIAPQELRAYGDREQTRTEHLRQVATFLGWRTADDREYEELDEFVLARAMEHDSPTLLFRLACDQLRSSRAIRPGPDVLSRRVGSARERAKAETYDRVVPVLTLRLRPELDGLLEVDPKLGSTRLTWLGRGATRSSPSAIRAELEKYAFLSGLEAVQLDLSMLPRERRRFLATIGRRSTAQALARREPERRSPILLARIEETAVDVLDEIVQLYDQAVSNVEGRAERKLEEVLVASAKGFGGPPGTHGRDARGDLRSGGPRRPGGPPRGHRDRSPPGRQGGGRAAAAPRRAPADD